MTDITTEDYANAVASLASLARRDTGGSRVAAQVLLSAYNGEQWQLDITDLCNLDRRYFEDALAVIRGRVELMIEPHTLIEDGETEFTELWEAWKRLNVQNRWKPTCRKCGGSGKVYRDDDDMDDEGTTCPRCEGAGYAA